MRNISKRLVLRAYPECSVDYVPTTKETELLTLDFDVKYKHGSGIDAGTGDACPRCGGKGHIGRTGIFDILPVTRAKMEMGIISPKTLASVFSRLELASTLLKIDSFSLTIPNDTRKRNFDDVFAIDDFGRISTANTGVEVRDINDVIYDDEGFMVGCNVIIDIKMNIGCRLS